MTLEFLVAETIPHGRLSLIYHQLASTQWFGMPVANTQAYRTQEGFTEDAVVNGVVESTGVHYAVIAGLRTETGPERLVIAYPNEESLRDLIAAPSIIAAGFSSHEEAVAGSRASAPTGVSHRVPEAIASKGIKRYQPRLKWTDYPQKTASTLGRLAKFLVTSYSDVATTAIVIFSSTNAFSSVVRMALGSSV